MATFKRTGVSNLDLHVATGTYYARIKRDGNTLRKSMGQNKAEAIDAKEAWLKELRGAPSRVQGTLGSLVELYLKWLKDQLTLKHISERTKDYKLELLAAIRRHWSEFDSVPISDLTEKLIRGFKVVMMEHYSPPRVNGAITVLREVMDIAKENNLLSTARRESLLEKLKFAEVDLDYKRKLGHLPDQADVLKLRAEVERRCKSRGELGHYLFDFLLFSGCRIDSAAHVFWVDVDYAKNELYFRVAKYGTYSIPIFGELKELLDRLDAVTGGAPDKKVLPTKSLQTVLTASCKALGLHHLSHHDLRHLFATRCIEAGKDFVTVAAWLGHKDNGRTVMAIYGHLRKEHSQKEAATMKFL